MTEPRAPEFDGSQPCREIGTLLFFPDTGDHGEQAKRVCRGCEFRRPCLEYALTATTLGDRFVVGIWGGTSSRQRDRIRALRQNGRAA